MNRCYKTFWNKAKNCFVVASEFARSCGKEKTTRRLRRAAAAQAVAVAVAAMSAMPASAEVGTATVTSTAGSEVTVLTGDAESVNSAVAQTATNAEAITNLQSAVGTKANSADVYTKTAADGVFATQAALKSVSDTATEADAAASANAANIQTNKEKIAANKESIESLTTEVGTKAAASDLADLSGKVTQEIADRKAADTTLTQTVADNKSAAESALSNETAARTEADTALAGRATALETKTANITASGTTTAVTGDLTATGKVTGASIADGTATLTGGKLTGLANTTWDGTPVSGQAATEDQLKTVADLAAKHSTVSAGDNISVAATTNENGSSDYAVSLKKDVDLTADGSLTVGGSSVNNAGVTATAVTATAVTATTLTDGTATLSGGKLTGLANTTWNGTPVSGQAATEDQLKTVADLAAKHTTVSAGDNVSVTKTDNTDGSADYAVSLKKDVDLTADGSLKAGGTEVTADGVKAAAVTGLQNKTWDAENITSGQAATEDQLKTVADRTTVLEENTVHISAGTAEPEEGEAQGAAYTKVDSDLNVTGVIQGASVTDGTATMKGGTLTGLANTEWSGTTDDRSRAATEGQLATVASKSHIFGGNSGSYQAPLSSTVNIKGEDNAGNLTTSVSGSGMEGTVLIKFSDTPKFTSVQTGHTLMNDSGVKIDSDDGKVVSLTSAGLNNGGNQIKGIAAATEDSDAVTYKQLKDTKAYFVGGNDATVVTVDDSFVGDGTQYKISFVDTDTTYEAGDGINLSGGAFSLNYDKKIFFMGANGLTLRSKFTFPGQAAVSFDGDQGILQGLTNTHWTTGGALRSGDIERPTFESSYAATEGQLYDLEQAGITLKGDINFQKFAIGETMPVLGDGKNISTVVNGQNGMVISISDEPEFTNVTATGKITASQVNVTGNDAWVVPARPGHDQIDHTVQYMADIAGFSGSNKAATEGQLYDAVQAAVNMDRYVTDGSVSGNTLTLYRNNAEDLHFELPTVTVNNVYDGTDMVHLYPDTEGAYADNDGNKNNWVAEEIVDDGEDPANPGHRLSHTESYRNTTLAVVGSSPKDADGNPITPSGSTNIELASVAEKVTAADGATSVYGQSFDIVDTAGNKVTVSDIASARVLARMDGNLINHEDRITEVEKGFSITAGDGIFAQTKKVDMGSNVIYTVNGGDPTYQNLSSTFQIDLGTRTGTIDISMSETPTFTYVTAGSGTDMVMIGNTESGNGVLVNGKTYISGNGLNANGQSVVNLPDEALIPGSNHAISVGTIYPTYKAVADGFMIMGNTGDFNVALLNDGTEAVSIVGDGRNLSTSASGGTLSVNFSENPLFNTVQVGTKDSRITIGDGNKRVITGLENTEWKMYDAAGKPMSPTYVADRAATEGELYGLMNGLTKRGLNFEGDDCVAKQVHTNLGETLKITGGNSTDVAWADEQNIAVHGDPASNTMIIRLAKNIKLGNDGSVTTGNSLMNTRGLNVREGDGSGATIANYTANGVTVDRPSDSGKNSLAFTTDRVSAGDQQIIHVNSGISGEKYAAEVDNIAINYGDLKKVRDETITKLTGDGMDFSGDAGTKVHRDLSTELKIKGGVAAADASDAANIAVVEDVTNSTLNLRLAKNIDLSADGSVKTGAAKMDNTGFTAGTNSGTKTEIADNAVKVGGNTYITNAGLNANNQQVKNVSSGIVKNATAEQIAANTNAANIADVKAMATVVKGDSNVTFTASDPDANGAVTYTAGLADSVTIGTAKPVTVNGTDGTVKGLTNTTWSQTATYTGGQAATQEQLKAAAGGVITSGLDFAGDSGTDVHRDLGTKLSVKGGATSYAAGNNIAVVANGTDTLQLRLAKEVDLGADGSLKTGATTVSNTGVVNGDTKLTSDGLSVGTGDGIVKIESNKIAVGGNTYVTNAGLNANSQQVTNVASGLGTNTNAANIADVKALATAVAGDDNVKFAASTDANGKTTYTASLADTVKIGGTNAVKVDGTAGTVTGLTNTTWSQTATYTGGQAATQEQLKAAAGGVIASGLDFAGDSGTDVHRDLGTKLSVKGGATTYAAGNNIAVVANGTDTLQLRLAKEVDLGADGSLKTGATTVNNTGVVNGDTKLTSDGLSVGTGDGIVKIESNKIAVGGNTYVTSAGLNANSQQVTNVASGLGANTNAANIADVKALATAVAGDDNVKFAASTDANGKTTYTASLADTVKIGGTNPVTVDGANGVVKGLTNTTWDQTATYAGGQAATQEQLKAAAGGVITSGLDFAGDSGTDVHRDLGTKLSVKGGATTYAAGNNIAVVANGTDTLQLRLAKEVDLGADGSLKTGATTVSNTGVVNGDTKLTSDGLSVGTGDGIVKIESNKIAVGGNTYVTSAGLNANSQQVTNVASGLGTNTNAANIADVKALATAVAGDDNVKFATSTDANGKTTYTASLADTVKIGTAKPVTIDGVNGTVTAGSSSVKSDGSAVFNTVHINGAGETGGGAQHAATITGLSNTTFDTTNIDSYKTSNRAATEAQLSVIAAKAADTETALSTKTFGIRAADNQSVTKTLDNVIDVVGADSNVTTKVADSKVQIAINKDLALDSVTAGTDAAKKVEIAENKIAVGGNTYVTNAGLNANSKQVTNVASGLGTDTNAANIADVKALATAVAGDDNVKFAASTDANGKTTYTASLADTVKIGTAKPVTVNGTDGVVTGLTNTAWDQTATYTGGQAATQEQLKAAAGGVITSGLDFAGDSGTDVHRDLGTKLSVKGGAATYAAGNNIAVVANGTDTLQLRLAKNVDLGADGSLVTGATTVNNTGVANGNTKLTSDGLSVGTGDDQVLINSNKVSVGGNTYVTNAGLNANSKQVTNVASGLGTDTNAANIADVKALATAVAGDDNVKFAASTDANGKTTYTASLADTVKIGTAKPVTVNGTDGVVTGLTNTTWDQTAAYTGGQAATQEQLKAAAGGVITSGLDFAGDSGTDVHRDLGTKLSVKGGAATYAAGNNIAVVANGTDTLQLRLAKNVDLGADGSLVTGATTVNNTGVANGNTKLTSDGLSVGTGSNQVLINSNAVAVGGKTYITNEGLNANSQQVKNVASGLGTDTNAANISDVKTLATSVAAGKNMTVSDETDTNGKKKYTVALNDDLLLGTGINQINISSSSRTVVIGGDTSKLTLNGANGTIAAGEKAFIDGVNGKASFGSVLIDGTQNSASVSGLSNTTWDQTATYTGGQAATQEQLKAATGGAITSGLNFAGDSGADVHRDLGTTLTVQGGVAKTDAAAGNNIAVIANGTDTLDLRLAKDVDLGSDGSLTTGGTKVDTNGVTNGSAALTGTGLTVGTDAGTKTEIADNKVAVGGNTYITNAGLNANGQQVTNVASGLGTAGSSANAANIDDVKKLATDVAAGKNMTVTETSDANGKKTFTVALADDITLGSGDKAVSISGTNGTVTAGTGANQVTMNGTNGTVTAGSGDKQVTLDGVNGTITTGSSTIGADGKATFGGVKIDGTAGSSTVSGLSNTTFDESNLSAYAGSDKAATEAQLKTVYDQAAKHTTVSAGDNVTVTKSENTDGSANYTVSVNKDVNLTADGSLTVGNSSVKDGAIQTGNVKLDGGGTITAGGVTIDGTAGNGSITGLKNTSYDVAANDSKVGSGQAATEGQLHDIVDKTTGGFGLTSDSGTAVKQNLGGTLAVTGDTNITTKTTSGGVQVTLNSSLKDLESVEVKGAGTNGEGAVQIAGNGIAVKGEAAADGSQKTTASLTSEGNAGKLTLSDKDGANTVITAGQGDAALSGDAITRVQYTDAGGAAHQAATLEDGMKYGADFGETTAVSLNHQVNILGEAASEADLTTGNIGVVAAQDGDNAKLTVKLNKDVNLGDTGSLKIGSASMSNDTISTSGTTISGGSVTTDKVTAATSVSVGSDTVITGDTVTTKTVKAGGTTVNSEGMTVEGGPSVTKTNVDMAGQQIHNVADGTAATDVATVGQLQTLASNTASSINNLGKRISSLQDETRAGIASAIAMASMPQAYRAGKSMMSVGTGYHKGGSALSVGVSSVSDNGSWVVKIQGSGNSEGDFSAGAGIGYMW